MYGILQDMQQLVWVSRSGEVEGTIGQPQVSIWEPSVSPDGSRVAVQGHERDSNDIWIHDVARGSKTRLTLDPALDDEPAWSPSGDRIAFTSTRLDGSWDVLVRSSDGSVESLVTGPSQEHAPNWSRDGRYLAYHSQAAEGGSRDIWYLDLSQGGEPTPFLQSDFEELVPQISPDARFLAYQSDEQGRFEVFVRDFPSGENRQVVSTAGGMHPRWSPTGDELFYLEGSTVRVVGVETGAVLTFGRPDALFNGEELGLQFYPLPMPDFPNYNVDNDGQRFVAVQALSGRDGNESQIVVVQNWYEEFRAEN